MMHPTTTTSGTQSESSRPSGGVSRQELMSMIAFSGRDRSEEERRTTKIGRRAGPGE